MSRKYSQKQFQSPWSSTDQKVQQIMKKYQKPPQPKSNNLRTPLATHNLAQAEPTERSPWKKQYYCTPSPSKQKQVYQPVGSKQNFSINKPYKDDKNRYRNDKYDDYSANNLSPKPKPYYNGQYAYDKNCSFNPFQEKSVKNEQDQILQAKKYLERKQKKYLKTQIPKNNISMQPHRQYINKYSPCQLPNDQYKKAFNNIEYEPRINNIERINDKIKKILDNTFNLQNNIPQSQEITYNKFKPKERIRDNLQSKTQLKIQEKVQRNPRQQSNNAGRQIYQRSKSCLNLKKKFLASNESHKINGAIENFNNKITEFQLSKQKLNTPSEKLQKMDQTFNPSSNISSFSNKNSKNQNINQQSNFSKNDQNEEKDENFQSPSLGLKEVDCQIESIVHDYQAAKWEQSVTFEQNKQIDNKEQIKEIMKGMQLRKKKLQIIPFESVKPTEIKNFFKMLSQQVQLDQSLQLSKKKFNRLYSNSVSVLQQLLSQRWRQMSLEEVQAQFEVKLEEEDPFYSYCQEQFEIEDLITDYIICTRHWRQKIEGKWNSSKLKQQLLFQRLDRQKKGYFQIQDLVREINMNEGVFYRNRNLYLIFQRISNNDKVNQISEQKLYSVLGQK